MNITVAASPSVDASIVKFDFETIQFDAVDFGLEIHGGDIMLFVDTFQETLKTFLREYLLG